MSCYICSENSRGKRVSFCMPVFTPLHLTGKLRNSSDDSYLAASTTRLPFSDKKKRRRTSAFQCFMRVLPYDLKHASTLFPIRPLPYFCSLSGCDSNDDKRALGGAAFSPCASGDYHPAIEHGTSGDYHPAMIMLSFYTAPQGPLSMTRAHI